MTHGKWPAGVLRHQNHPVITCGCSGGHQRRVTLCNRKWPLHLTVTIELQAVHGWFLVCEKPAKEGDAGEDRGDNDHSSTDKDEKEEEKEEKKDRGRKRNTGQRGLY